MGLGYLQALKPELQQTREAPAHPAQHRWFSQGSVGLGSAYRAGIHPAHRAFAPMGVSRHGQELPWAGASPSGEDRMQEAHAEDAGSRHI